MPDNPHPKIKTPTPSRWDVFIAHASEDKDDVVRPLAEELKSRGLRVWYDEFEIKVGDSLRAKIDEGLAQSHHGVVILSSHFFVKWWPPDELGGLIALEEGSRRRILPVWHRTTKYEVRKFSPTLADRRAARTDQKIEDLADELIDAMDVELAEDPSQAPLGQGVSLSPPPAEIELEIVPSGAALLDALLGNEEGSFDLDTIADQSQREEVAEGLDELRETSEIWTDLALVDRERFRARASEFVIGLMEQDLLPQVGRYERRLTGPDGSTTPWRGVVVRIAPVGAQNETETGSSPDATDQLILDELLGLLPRSSMRLLREEDFNEPWRDRVKTPLRFLVNEYDEVEHRFGDPELEASRQRLMQAANYFLHQEAMNGFSNRFDPTRRDAGYTPAEAEGDEQRESLIRRRARTIADSAADLLSSYDDLVGIARGRGYRLDAIKGGRHTRVAAFDQDLGL